MSNSSEQVRVAWQVVITARHFIKKNLETGLWPCVA